MPPLLTIKDAAPLLGKTPGGLRKLIDRSRRAAAGRHVDGATIQFAQDGPHGTILFRPAWIEEYLDRITVDGTKPVERRPATGRRASVRPARVEISWDSI